MASRTPLPPKRFLSPSRSSSASREPVDAPEGTAARPRAPPSRMQSTSIVGLPRESRISRAKSSTILNMARALYTAESGMPSITVLYDGQEEQVRADALAEGKKVPELVCKQIASVLGKRGHSIKCLAAEAPLKKLVRQLEDDASDLILNEFHNPALVEQYIDGREIYVSLIGNPPVVLPPIEWDLSKLPPELPRIAGTEAKWDHDFKEAKEFVPKDIVENEEVMTRIREAAIGAWNALLIRDYARIDMRLTPDGVPYVIEVNPNPWLDSSAEFAMAARRAKPEMSHGDVIERIVELAMRHPIRERSAI